MCDLFLVQVRRQSPSPLHVCSRARRACFAAAGSPAPAPTGFMPDRPRRRQRTALQLIADRRDYSMVWPTSRTAAPTAPRAASADRLSRPHTPASFDRARSCSGMAASTWARLPRLQIVDDIGGVVGVHFLQRLGQRAEGMCSSTSSRISVSSSARTSSKVSAQVGQDILAIFGRRKPSVATSAGCSAVTISLRRPASPRSVASIPSRQGRVQRVVVLEREVSRSSSAAFWSIGSVSSRVMRTSLVEMDGYAFSLASKNSCSRCGREDSNFHGFPTATSTLRVYQFRHDRPCEARG